MPSFAGQGPTGYTRSDERIFEDVCEALTHDVALDARWLRVTVREGCVVLDGRVDSRDAKFHAETIVEGIRGVHEIDNRLRVAGHSAFEGIPDHGVFGRLAEEHRLVEAMFDIVLDTPSGEASDRHAAFRTLERELLVHMHAEEEIVYHELDGSHEEHGAIRIARAQHARIEAMLRELAPLDPASAAWTAAVRQLRRAVDDHVAMEERELIPRARYVLSVFHQDDLRNLYERERAILIQRLDAPPPREVEAAPTGGTSTTEPPTPLASSARPPQAVAAVDVHKIK